MAQRWRGSLESAYSVWGGSGSCVSVEPSTFRREFRHVKSYEVTTDLVGMTISH